MKALVCSACNLIILKDEKPEKCPLCQATKFEKKEDAIHKPGDVTNFTESEKKHIPSILIAKTCGLIGEGCKDVHVKVGEIVHPMLAEHFINNIDFYIDKEFVARQELRPDRIYPAAAIHIKTVGKTLTVIERCNIHGAWIAEAKF